MGNQKRKGCRSCNLYSYALGRCVAGKINPRTIHGAVDAAQFMGITYICDVNGMRQKVIRELSKREFEKAREALVGRTLEILPTGAGEEVGE